MRIFYTTLNLILALWVLFIGAVFFSLDNASGYLFAAISLLVAGFLYTRIMWSYFAAAVLGVASFQLAKIGFEFDYSPHIVMASGALIIPLAIFLSVKIGRKSSKKTDR